MMNNKGSLIMSEVKNEKMKEEQKVSDAMHLMIDDMFDELVDQAKNNK